MTGRLVHSEELTRYDFGDDHAMGPGRVRHTIELADQLGVLDLLEVIPPPPIDDDLILSVHDRDYVDAVKANVENLAYGLGSTDNPIFPRMHDVSATVAMATVEAARSVWRGEVRRACNISGGLHHAMPRATSGFCVYNDLAVSISWLLANGAERIAYVDVDVHHGDGVQQIFYHDPRVLTISLHETPAVLFPGTGFPSETGGPDAVGSAVNVALPAGTGDSGWLRAFHAVVPQALRAFQPQILVTQHGCDSHQHDPLADLELTVDGQRASYLALAELADELCEGRWVSTGGGGYSITNVVPRAWTHLLAIVGGRPLSPQTPTPERWRAGLGATYLPMAMTDGVEVGYTDFESGFSPTSRLDQAILATRKAVFPELGLDPGI
jgi:acetoin utilization protein AcuC